MHNQGSNANNLQACLLVTSVFRNILRYAIVMLTVFVSMLHGLQIPNWAAALAVVTLTKDAQHVQNRQLHMWTLIWHAQASSI